MHTQGGAHTRRCTQKVVCSHHRSFIISGGVRGLAPSSSEASRGNGRFGGSHTRPVHTQGGAHKRRFVATASVLLFQRGLREAGPRIEPSEPSCRGKFWQFTHKGGAHTRRCTHKALHTQGGAHNTWSVASAGVLLCKRGREGWLPASSEAGRGKGSFGSSHTRRCTHKAVHTTGSL